MCIFKVIFSTMFLIFATMKKNKFPIYPFYKINIWRIGLIIFLSILVNYNLNAQNFLLYGKVSERDTGIIILNYVNDVEVLINDTTRLKNGHFSFSGKIKGTTFVALKGEKYYINGNDVNYTNFFIDAGKQFIYLKEQDYENALIDGCKTQKEFTDLLHSINLLKLKYGLKKDSVKWFKEYLQEPNINAFDITKAELNINRIREEIKQEDSLRLDIQKKFIKQNPSSLVSSYFLRFMKLEIDTLEHYYNLLDESVKTHVWGIEINNSIIKRKRVAIGKQAPNFEFTDIQGIKRTLNNFKGKVVILEFWASWCKPCREGFPKLKSVINQFASNKLTIIAIADNDNTVSEWKKAIEKDDIAMWYHTLRGLNTIQDINSLFTVSYLPTKIIIDANGIIAAKYIGNSSDDFFEQTLKELFKN